MFKWDQFKIMEKKVYLRGLSRICLAFLNVWKQMCSLGLRKFWYLLEIYSLAIPGRQWTLHIKQVHWPSPRPYSDLNTRLSEISKIEKNSLLFWKCQRWSQFKTMQNGNFVNSLHQYINLYLSSNLTCDTTASTSSPNDSFIGFDVK